MSRKVTPSSLGTEIAYGMCTCTLLFSGALQRFVVPAGAGQGSQAGPSPVPFFLSFFGVLPTHAVSPNIRLTENKPDIE
jgi:hypothetical protein